MQISKLLQAAQNYDALLLDAYGVFWAGGSIGLLPGSKEAMEALKSSKKCVGILSNTTQLPEKEELKLEKYGLVKGEHYDFLLTSGRVAQNFFAQDDLGFVTKNKKYYVFSEPHPRYALPKHLFDYSSFTETSDLSSADFIYISIPHIDGEDQIDPEVFREEVKNIVSSGLPMVCTNPDHFANEGEQLVVRQGAIASLYEEYGGIVHYMGKPYPSAYKLAMAEFEKKQIIDPSRILMVGDTPETDILGARSFGMDGALILETGIMCERIRQKGLVHAIENLIGKNIPNYLLKKFQID